MCMYALKFAVSCTVFFAASKQLDRLRHGNRSCVFFIRHVCSGQSSHYCRTWWQDDLWPAQSGPVWTFNPGKFWTAQRVDRKKCVRWHWKMVNGKPTLPEMTLNTNCTYVIQQRSFFFWGPSQTWTQVFVIEGMRAALRLLILVRTNFSFLAHGGKMVPENISNHESIVGVRGGAILFPPSPPSNRSFDCSWCMDLILTNFSPGADSKPSTPTRIQFLSEMFHVLRPVVELILRFACVCKACSNSAILKCCSSSFARRIAFPRSWTPLVVAMAMDSISLWLSSMSKSMLDK